MQGKSIIHCIMKKILKRILIGIVCTTAAVFAFFFGLGYYIVHYEMNKEPQEEYVCIGQHVYTHAQALMVDSLFDSLNLSGKGIRIGVLDAGFGTFRQRAWTRHLNVAAYADFVDGDTLKPDVCAYATPPLEGSSFTTPVITGLCAALLEHRRISRKEMITLLHTSGNNASYLNHETGYGIPQTRTMNHFLQ